MASIRYRARWRVIVKGEDQPEGHALRLVDEIQRYGGLADPFWTFGGGTVLMFRYGHRLSKDIDIVVPDPKYLGYVTPRLSGTAASLTEDYTEMAGSFVIDCNRGIADSLVSKAEVEKRIT